MTSPVDITLVSGGTTVTFDPDDLEWTDRRARNVIQQTQDFAANGANIIEEFQQIGGYPITLQTLADCWVTQAQVDALITLADSLLSAPMTLTFNDGTVVFVRFRYDGTTPAVDAQPIWDAIPRDGEFPYSLTIRLVQSST